MQPDLTKHKIALVALAGLFAFLALTTPKFFREIGSAEWSSTSGVVTRSSITAAHFSRGHFSGYIPKVEYRYAVDGHQFTGTRITFHLDETIYRKGYAESWVTQYPTGKVVSVYYDPAAPSSAVLRPGMQSEQRWIFYAGIGYMVIFAVAFFVVLYDYRKSGALAATFHEKYTRRREV
jgi:hypothetical protein